jgi:methionyl-tRNA synthetase
MLIALKRELPRQVYAHSFWISEGQKMSKSLGNFIDLEKIDRYVANFGLDALRYFLGRHGPLGINDSDFAEVRFNEVYNAELADKLGNLVNRTLTMIQRYRSGLVPEPYDKALRAEAERTVATYRDGMNRLEFVGALEALWGFVVRSNQYVEESAPWKLAKDPAKARQLDGVLYNLAESVRLISVLVAPFMPTIAGQIRTQLGVADKMGLLDVEISWGRLSPGTRIGQVAPLFPKRT